MMKRSLLLPAGMLLVLSSLAWALEVPYLSGRVNDSAGMMDAESRSRLEKKLEILEKDTGAQVVVLTIGSLEGDVLEDYSLRVAETWKLGRKGKDDGLLILIAKKERRIRFEVGYGLEGIIPDARAKQIIDGIMTPAFRDGRFAEGIEKAVDAISALIRGETVEIPDGSREYSLGEELIGRLVSAVIFFVVIGIFSVQAVFNKDGGAWFLYIFLMPFYMVFPWAIFGKYGLIFLIGWIIGFPILRRRTWHSEWGRHFRAAHPGWVSMGRSGGSSGGGFSGGFSGGGGSFGGGGASGGW